MVGPSGDRQAKRPFDREYVNTSTCIEAALYPVAWAPVGPAAAAAFAPSMVLPFKIGSAPVLFITTKTKSVAVEPSCTPILPWSSLYIAGAPQSPFISAPLRQTNTPRP